MDGGALAVIAGSTLFGGGLAALTGAYGLSRTRRLSRTGERVPALVKQFPGQAAAEAPAPRPMLQFATHDDRVLEIACPVPPTSRIPLNDGDTVLVSYDPADPRNVVVHGRERRSLEYAFIAAGVAVILLSVTLLAFAAG